MYKNPQYYLQSSQKLKVSLFLIFSFLFCQSLSSQFYWQKLYHPLTDGTEEIFDICNAGGSDFFAVGFTATPLRKVYLLKINQLGDTLFSKIYNIQESYDIVSTNDSGCIFTGYNGSGYACRVNKNGEIVWYRNYNSSGINDISKTIDGNYILCGGRTIGLSIIGYIVKINPNGDVLWEREYITGSDERFYKINMALGSGYIVLGEKTISNETNNLMLKLDDTGAVIWSKNYRLNYSTSSTDYTDYNDFGYITVGTTLMHPTETDSFRVFVCKTKNQGDTLKTRIFNSNIYEALPSIAKLSNNRFVVSILGKYVSKAVVIDTNLNIIRSLNFPLIENFTHIFSVMVAPGSNIKDLIFTGWANFDAYIVRIDSSLSPPPPIGITISTTIVKNSILKQNFPNPFNSETIIGFALKETSNARIEIFDVLGKNVLVLVNKKFMQGEHSVRINSHYLSSGIYFYKLTINNKQSIVKKMCIIK